MSDLTENQRGQIIGLHKSGASYRSISKTLGFPTTAVFRTVKNFKIVWRIYQEVVAQKF